MAGPDGSNPFDNAFGAAPSGPSGSTGSGSGFSFGASTTKQTPDKTSLVIEYFAGVLSYDDLVNLVGADDAQAIANTPLTSSEKQAVANLRAQSNSANIPPPAPSAVPDATTKPKDVTGSYAFQGNLSIDKYGGAVYYTDPVTGDRRLVQGPVAPDNLTDASRFSLTSRNGQTVILDNDTGRILPVDQGAIDTQVAASAANGGSGAGAGGGTGTGPKAPLTIEEQQALNRQAEAEQNARAQGAITAWKQQNPDYQDLGAGYVQNPKTGAYGTLQYDDRTGEVSLRPETPISTPGSDPYGNLNMQDVGKFQGTDEQKALLAADPELRASTYAQAHGGQVGTDSQQSLWLGESIGNKTTQDYQDLTKNEQVATEIPGRIYRDRTAEGGVGTNTPINEAVSLGSVANGMQELNPWQRALYDNPNTHSLTTGVPDATLVVGDQTYPAYSSVGAGPSQTLLGAKVAAATRSMLAGTLGQEGEGYGVVQSGNPLGAGTGPYSAHEAKIAGDATASASVGGGQNDTSGAGLGRGNADWDAGYADGLAARDARSNASTQYMIGYTAGIAAHNNGGIDPNSASDAQGKQSQPSNYFPDIKPAPGSSFGPNDTATAPSAGDSSGNYGSFLPPGLPKPPPDQQPPAPSTPPRPSGPVIYQATGGTDYAGGSLLPLSVRNAAAGHNGFVTPEQIDMVGHSTGKLYGVAGEGPDGMGPQTSPEYVSEGPPTPQGQAINVTPLVSTMLPPAGTPLPTTPTLLSTRLRQTRLAKVKIALG